MRRFRPSRVLLGALLAGIMAASVNILWWFVWPTLTGRVAPEMVEPTSITFASIVPGLLGAFVLLFFDRWTQRPVRNFLLLASFVFLASLGGPLTDPLPDGTPAPPGFFWLTMPMHVVAAGLAVYFPLVLGKVKTR